MDLRKESWPPSLHNFIAVKRHVVSRLRFAAELRDSQWTRSFPSWSMMFEVRIDL
jgi:hypothetical protein